MKKNRKVLHVFGKMDRGGAQLRTLDLIKKTSGMGIVHYCCSLSGEKGDLDAVLREAGGDVFYINIFSFGFVLKFIRLLRQNKFDVVHTHVHLVSGLMVFLAYLSGVTSRIVHFRSTGDGIDNSVSRKARNALLRFLIWKFATNILAVSKSAMEMALGNRRAYDSRCRVVYNIIYNRDFDSSSEYLRVLRNKFDPGNQKKIIVHVGRFAEPKNHLRLLGIFKKLVEIRSDSILLLIGLGGNDIESKCIKYVTENLLQDKVFFLGSTSNVFKFLAVSDVMLFPSLWEGLPGAVLESLSVGTPVLASSIPVILEVESNLDGLETCLLADCDEIWVDHLISLMNNFGEVGARAKIVESFNSSPFSSRKSLECESFYLSIWQGGR